MSQALARKPIRPSRRSTDLVSHTATGGPARGIALGAALSAPMWVGILYLLRSVVGSF